MYWEVALHYLCMDCVAESLQTVKTGQKFLGVLTGHIMFPDCVYGMPTMMEFHPLMISSHLEDIQLLMPNNTQSTMMSVVRK